MNFIYGEYNFEEGTEIFISIFFSQRINLFQCKDEVIFRLEYHTSTILQIITGHTQSLQYIPSPEKLNMLPTTQLNTNYCFPYFLYT